MSTSRVTLILSSVIAALALVAAGAGLFWRIEGSSFAFTTLNGETVQIYGNGLYRHDTLFVGALNRGTDAIVLVLGAPLLVISGIMHWRGSVRGGLLLLGTLGFFLYVYASAALGATAYNKLFLVYVVLFSASLYAFVLAFVSIDLDMLSAFFTAIPRRAPGIFMIASGAVTLVVWLVPLLGSILQGVPPETLDIYTGRVTDVLDLGIITPTTFISGVLILRREPLGYLIAFSILVLEMTLAPIIVAQTTSQLLAGITLTPGEIIGPVAGFMILGVAAVWVYVALLRPISGSWETGNDSH